MRVFIETSAKGAVSLLSLGNAQDLNRHELALKARLNNIGYRN